MKTATELYSQAQDELARFGANACLTVKCRDVLAILSGEPAELRRYHVRIDYAGSGSLSYVVAAAHIADACADAWRTVENCRSDAGGASVHVSDLANDLADARNRIAALEDAERALRGEWATERLDTYRQIAGRDREIERLDALLNPKTAVDLDVGLVCTRERPCTICGGSRP